MTTYEIYLLLGSFFGIFAIISIASAILNEGSVRATVLLICISGGFLFMAKRNTDGILSLDHVAPAINKLVGMFLG